MSGWRVLPDESPCAPYSPPRKHFTEYSKKTEDVVSEIRLTSLVPAGG